MGDAPFEAAGGFAVGHAVGRLLGVVGGAEAVGQSDLGDSDAVHRGVQLAVA